MPGIHFVSTFDGDPFIKSANAILNSVKTMAAQVERAGGDMQNVMNGIFNNGQLGRGMDDFFNSIIDNFNLSKKAAEVFRKKAEASIQAIASSSDDAQTKINKIVTSMAQLASEAKQVDMSGLADESVGKRSLEDMRTATAFLIDSLNEAIESAEELQGAFEQKKGKSLEDKIQDIENYQKSLEEAKRIAETTYASQEEYIKGLREELAKLTENINNSSDQSQIAQWNKEADDLTNRLTDAEKVLEKIKDTSENIDINIEGLDKPKERLQIYKDLKDELKDYGKIFDEIEFGTKGADKAFEEYANKTKSSTEQMKSNLKQIAQLAGIAFGLNEAKNFVENIVSVRTDFQDIESSMKVFLGNEEKASEFVNKLKDYAWYNMFEFKDLTKASQQMIAYGHDVDTIIPKLDMLSNIAAGTHAPLMEMVDAYNRAKSTGVVDANGVKSWATKGVVIKDVLREMGETAVGTSISFEQLNKVLEHMTGEGGMFHNLMAEQLNNISAEKGQLEDNLTNMYNEIGEKLQGAITKWYKIQSDMVDNYVDIAGGNETIDFVVNFVEHGFDELASNWKTLLDYVKNAIVLYGSWRVSLALIEPMRKATVWWTNAEATAHEINAGKIKLETIAQGEATAGKVRALQVTKALNASILASPWTWAAVALTGLAYAVYSYYDNILTADEAQRRVNSSIDEYKDKLKEAQDADMENINAIKSQTASLYEQYKAYKDLIEARAIFAKFSPEEIKNMSPDMIKQMLNQDDANKVENMLKGQIDALKEYYKWLESTNSVINSSFNVIGAKENFEKILGNFNIPKETIDKLWDDVGWNTNLKDFTNTLIDATSDSLSETLSDKAKAGIINGFDEGLSDEGLKSKASEMIEKFSEEVSKKTSDLEKKISELEELKASKGLGNAQEKVLQQYHDELDKINGDITSKYQRQINGFLDTATKNIEKLRKEYVVAPDSKKSDIELKLQTEQKTQEFLLGLMKFFEEGTTNKELIIEVTNKTDNIQVGDDFLIELGKEYENVDGIVADYLGRLDQARASTEDLGAISIQQASEIAESYGLTAENVEEDFGNTETAISDDITALRKKLDEDLTDDEKNKINLQITRKQEQLYYIQNLHRQMSQLVQNPYNIMVNIKTKIEEGIRKLLGLDTKTTETNTTETPSQKAQRERREAEERRKKEEEETKQTGAQWKAKYEANKKKEIADLQAKLKTPLTQAEYDAAMARLNELTKGADKAANAAKKKAKEAADQQAKSIQQQLKYNDELQKLQDEAAEARSKAEIAAIRNDAERERKEREYQHKKTLADIADQQDDIYKKIYQDRKAAYENANKNKKYENTEAGAAGWAGIKNQIESSKSLEEVKKAQWEIIKASTIPTETLQKLNDMSSQGNVDLIARPFIEAAELVKKGWKDAGDGIATVFSSQYGVKDSNGNVRELLVTPILPDGSVLSENELEDYLFNTLHGTEDILKADTKGIVISVGEVGFEGDLGGDALHQLQADLIDLPTDKLKEIQQLYKDINTNPEFNAIRDLLNNLGKVDASQLDDLYDKIDKLDLSKVFTGDNADKEIAQWKENTKIRLSLAADENTRNARQEMEYQKQRIQSMRDYLKEYGTFQQQRLAIAEEYDEKIKNLDPTDEWGKKILEQQQKAADNAIEIKSLEYKIDWSMAFDGFSEAFQAEAKNTLDNIEAYMRTKDFAGKDTATKAEYVRLRNELSDKIGGSVGTFNLSIYGKIGEQMKEYQQKLLEAKLVEEQHNNATKELLEAKMQFAEAEEAAKTATDQQTARLAVENARANVQTKQQRFDNTKKNLEDKKGEANIAKSNLQKSVTDSRKAIDNFSNALKQITDGTLRGFADGLVNIVNAIKGNGLTNGLAGLGMNIKKTSDLFSNQEVLNANIKADADNAINSLRNAFGGADKLSKALSKDFTKVEETSSDALGATETVLGTISAVAGQSGNAWGMIIAAILDILDAIGDDFPGFIEELLDSVFDAVLSILESITYDANEGLGGLIPEFLEKILESIWIFISESLSNMAEQMAFIDLGIRYSNHEEQLKIQEELNKEIESTTNALKHFGEELKESYGAKALEVAQKRLELIEKNQGSILKGIDAALWDNYGGGRSDYWHWNGNTEVARQMAERYGLSFDGTWNSLFMGNDPQKLAEAIRDARDTEVEWWTTMTTIGYNDGVVAEWLEKLANTAEEYEETTKNLKEQLAGTTFDDVFGDFMDALYDLADGSEDVFDDIADNWQKMINKMVINNILAQKMKDELTKWYESFSNTDPEDKDALENLRTEYFNLLQSGADEVERLRRMGIVLPTKSSEKDQQSSTYNSAKNITYEQADAITGILLNHTILFEQIKAILEDWNSRKEEGEGADANAALAIAESVKNCVDGLDIDVKPEIDLLTLEDVYRRILSNIPAADLLSADTEKMSELYGQIIGVIGSMTVPPTTFLDAITALANGGAFSDILNKDMPVVTTDTNGSNEISNLILTNLNTMQSIVSGYGGTLLDIRQFLWLGNETRESMFKAMKEHYANFDTKIDRVINEIRNQ